MGNRRDNYTLRALVADVAYRKRRAAVARFSGTAPGAEVPREVYLSACGTIADHLGSHGFSYAKSGPHCRKVGDQFTYRISFQSSYHNVAGEHVSLSVHGAVLSRKFKKWLASHPELYASNYVAGGQIGNLQEEPCWVTWELSDPIDRDETIGNVIQTVDQIVLPYFARFEDIPTLVRSLVAEGCPGMSIRGVVEFLMWLGEESAARSAGKNFLRRRIDLIDAYGVAFAQSNGSDLTAPMTGSFAENLAFVSHVFGFGDLRIGAC